MPLPATSPKQWMLGLPGHNEVMRLEEVLLLVKGGQLRPTDLVKKLGDPWRAANEVPELMVYFSDPRKMAAIADGAGISTKPAEEKPEPEEPPVRETSRGTPVAPGARSPSPATSRIPTAGSRPPQSRPAPVERTERRPAPVPKGDTRPPESATPRTEAPRSETKPPEAVKSETKPPPLIEPPAEPPAPEAKKDPLNEGGKVAPVEEKPRGLRARGLPKPPPPRPASVPRLEPMVGKYFGPGDLLRSASFAFDPLKLLLTLPFAAILGISTSILFHLSGDRDTVREWAFSILAMTLWIFGLAFIWTMLAYVTRRQVEFKPYGAAEVIRYGTSSLATSIIYPLYALAPSLIAIGVLWLFRLIRNGGAGGASFVKIIYFVPMAFAFLAVAGALIYQLASMYVPSTAAIEGHSVQGAVKAAFDIVRRQWGRVVLHWLIVSVAVGVIAFVSVGLSLVAFVLPSIVFGRTEDFRIIQAWNNFSGLATVYQGLALGVGLTLPISLLSTLGTLSYLALRHPASAQLSPAPPDETSGDGLESSHGGTSHPGEATQPGETRPAPAEGSGANEVSDDSDEQPLVPGG